jgi:hypothetical protein
MEEGKKTEEHPEKEKQESSEKQERQKVKEAEKEEASPPAQPKKDAFISEELEGLEEEKKKFGYSTHVKSDKNFVIMLAVFIIFLGLLLFVYPLIFGNTKILTIDDLHEENFAGKLDEEEGYLYNGFSFVKYNDQWYTRFKRRDNNQSYNVQFRFSPKEVEHVPLSGDYSQLLQENSTYVTFDPTPDNLSSTALAAADLSVSLVKVFDIIPVAACTKNETRACQTRPILECKPGFPVVYLKNASIAGASMQGTCLTIQGEGIDLVKAVDRVLMGWYGVME